MIESACTTFLSLVLPRFADQSKWKFDRLRIDDDVMEELEIALPGFPIRYSVESRFQVEVSHRRLSPQFSCSIPYTVEFSILFFPFEVPMVKHLRESIAP